MAMTPKEMADQGKVFAEANKAKTVRNYSMYSVVLAAPVVKAKPNG